MLSGADFDDLHDLAFETAGVEASWEAPGQVATPVQAVFYQTTHVPTDLGMVLDDRSSVKLPRAFVGDAPRGILRIGDQAFSLDRPVDGSGDEYVTHIFVRRVAA